MLERLGHFLVRRRWWVMAATLLMILCAGAFGGNVAEYLKAGGFDPPDSESQRAAEILGETFDQAPPNFLLLVEAKQGTVNDPAARRAGVELTNELLREEHVGQVLSHFSFGEGSPLESKDATKALVIAQVEGRDDEERGKRTDALIPRYVRETDTLRIRVGGFEALFDEVSDQIETDLARGEGLAIPITLVLLIVVFGSIVAASMPLAIGIIAVLGTFLVLRLVAGVTDVSVFALSMVTAMGLGLAIDYSLFIVSRFREELRKGADTETAVVTTVRTAGRTIIFSGLTVAMSLSALLVFPVYFFKSFGYAGMGVVVTAVVGAVIFLPAMLAALGPRVDWSPASWKPQPGTFILFKILWFLPPVFAMLLFSRFVGNWQRAHHKDVGEGFWHRLAMFVMRRPVVVGLTVVAVLLALGIPFLHVDLGLPDERVLPPSAETRQVHDALREEFSSDEVNSIRVVAPKTGNPIRMRAEIGAYAAALSRLPGVQNVDSIAGQHTDGVLTAGPGIATARFAAADASWLSVIPEVHPFSVEAEELVQAIRTTEAPWDVVVGGSSAQLVDVKASLFGRLPVALALIAVSTFVLLFLMFGSLLVPVKALVLNLLSLTATFGAMVWVFQDGHLSGVLNFTASGTLDISSPILMFCIAFGLSMDFEVFLLSRIKEEYDLTGDNEQSVAVGLERTGRIVTAAAVLISVTFLAIGMSSVRFIKLFGIGMTLAVLMDAFVIRGTLVPAFMRLAGRANWWLPAFLRPLHDRLQIREVHDLPAQAVAAEGDGAATAAATRAKRTAEAPAGGGTTTRTRSTTATRSKAKPKSNGKATSKSKAKAKAKPKASSRKPAKRKS